MSARRASRLFLCAFAAAVLIALRAVGLGLDMAGAWSALLSCLAGIVGASFYKPGRVEGLDRAVAAVEALSMLTVISLLGGVASYVVAARTSGYVDPILSGADAALGLDWLTLWRIVHRIPYAVGILNAGYASIIVAPALIIIGLAAAGESERAYRFVLAFAITLALTDLIFIVAPARSAAATYFGADAPFLQAIHKEHIGIIDALRAGGMTGIPLNHVIGLITFPSFHAASAILFIWAAWSRLWLRVPMLIVNIDMLVATPTQGSHYFVDLFGGCLVAAIGIAAARVTTRQPHGTTAVSWTPALARPLSTANAQT